VKCTDIINAKFFSSNDLADSNQVLKTVSESYHPECAISCPALDVSKVEGFGVVWRLGLGLEEENSSAQMGWSLVLLGSLLLNHFFFQATGITLRSDGIPLSSVEKQLSLNHSYSASDEWMIFFGSQI
jgi:hypothetical protein